MKTIYAEPSPPSECLGWELFWVVVVPVPVLFIVCLLSC